MGRSVLWRVLAGQQPERKFRSRSAAYTYAHERQTAGDRVSVWHYERNGWVLYERLSMNKEK